MTIDRSVPEHLVRYVGALPGFQISTEVACNYGHIAATLADAVLQANNNYARNVQPRIDRIRRIYAAETTLQDLKALLLTISIADLLNWQGERRTTTFRVLVELLEQDEVNTEADLRNWLQREDSGGKLQQIRFIGPKTVDYLKILVGLQAVAIDRHLAKFLCNAGASGLRSYTQRQSLIHQAAALMGLTVAQLDHSIWRYMSSAKPKPACPKRTFLPDRNR